MAEKGRRDLTGNRFQDDVAAGGAKQAMLIKQDELIDIMKSLMAKLDSDAGVGDTDYASALSDALDKVDLK